MHDSGDGSNDDLHDSQVVKNGHHRRKENDRRQNAKGNRSDQRVVRRVTGFVRAGVDSKDELRPFVGKGLHVLEHVAEPLKRCESGVGFQNEQSQSKLQSETTGYDPAVDLLSVGAHRPGEAHHHKQAAETHNAFHSDVPVCRCELVIKDGRRDTDFLSVA